MGADREHERERRDVEDEEVQGHGEGDGRQEPQVRPRGQDPANAPTQGSVGGYRN